MKKYRHHAVVVGGNLDSASRYLSLNFPSWDVVAMDYDGVHTTIVHREEIDPTDSMVRVNQLQSAVNAAFYALQSAGTPADAFNAAYTELQPFVK